MTQDICINTFEDLVKLYTLFTLLETTNGKVTPIIADSAGFSARFGISINNNKTRFIWKM